VNELSRIRLEEAVALSAWTSPGEPDEVYPRRVVRVMGNHARRAWAMNRLRMPAKKVDFESQIDRLSIALAKDWTERVLTGLKGAGLHCLQAGLEWDAFGLWVPEEREANGFALPRKPYRFKFFVCAEIIDHSEEQNVTPERCWSPPDDQVWMPRWKWIKVKFFDIFGNEHVEEFEDFMATLVQHEMAHGENDLIVDHRKYPISWDIYDVALNAVEKIRTEIPLQPEDWRIREAMRRITEFETAHPEEALRILRAMPEARMQSEQLAAGSYLLKGVPKIPM